MGTRSTIAIQNANGTVTGIYCHWDGYLSHNGRILQENYTTEAEVRELLALGDLSSLGANIGEQTDFSAPADGQCVAYGRDRGETGIEAKTFESYAELIEQMGQEYDYLFANGVWTVHSYDGTAVLTEALAQEAQEA
jgi:hypothetical protein